MRTVIYFSLAFAFSELLLMLVKRSRYESVKERNDRGSLILIWLTITGGFVGGFFLSNPPDRFWLGFGIPFIIGGLFVRWIAILQLGSSFTVDVAINNASQLKTDGIYERIRHPSYSGMLLVVVGFASTMNSIYSFLVLVVPVFAAVIYRVRIEESLLKKEFGESYLKYSKDTKKLIPGIY